MRIGITTGGGDCPGLNAVIRAVVRTAVHQNGWQVVGLRDGLQGLYDIQRAIELSSADVRDILTRGGTILGTSNRGNPFHFPVERDGKMVEEDVSDVLLANARALGLDCIVFVGGDGTQGIAQGFSDKGMPVIGVPKTIDNDLDATDYTFGFDTAVLVATDALDRLRTTAESHDRVMVLEVMGRDAGWIALHAGIAGDADVVLIPEIPWDVEAVTTFLQRRSRAGLTHSVVCVAEGAAPRGGSQAYIESAVAGKNARLGGAGEVFARAIADRVDHEIRVTVLGHVQRGGSPTAVDRVLGTRMGVHAVELIAAGRFGHMVCLRGTEISAVPIPDAIGRNKQVDPEGSLVRAARAVGICMGDRA